MDSPKLRFTGFKGDWKKVKFNSLFSEVNEKTGDTKNFPLYSLTVQDGVTKKTERYNREFLVKKEDNFKIVRANYFVSNPMNMTIGALAQYKGKGDISVSGYYNVFKNISKYKNQFLEDFLKSSKMIWLYKSIATGSLIEKQRVHFSQFIELTVKLPDYNEANKISDFMEILTKKVQHQQEKIYLLKEQEKGYMQNIFRQELRFKDKHGQDFPEWDINVKAGELFEPISNKNHDGSIPVLSATQDSGMVYRDSLERQMAFNDKNLKSYKLVEKNDFIISLRSFQGGIELSNLQGLVSPAYTVFRKKSSKVYEPYFAKIFKTDFFIQLLNSTTYGIRDGKAISYKDFSTLKFSIPSLEEQKKIAEFLSVLHKKIQIENEKLVSLQKHKQAFMQQLFI